MELLAITLLFGLVGGIEQESRLFEFYGPVFVVPVHVHDGEAGLQRPRVHHLPHVYILAIFFGCLSINIQHG